MKPENNLSNDEKRALTSIHETYTLSNTDEYISEIDKLTVKNFLNVLAEMALTAASRKVKESEGKR